MDIARSLLFVGTVLPSCATVSLLEGALSLQLLEVILDQSLFQNEGVCIL